LEALGGVLDAEGHLLRQVDRARPPALHSDAAPARELVSQGLAGAAQQRCGVGIGSRSGCIQHPIPPD
jgi:hypothetical protein